MGAPSGPQPTVLPATDYTTQNCTNLSIYCPVEFTIYGYFPSVGANAFFVAFFAIACAIQLFAGIRYRTWTFLIALFWGTFGEALGYVGRIMLHHNPWSETGFDIQICCIIIAPAFLAAGIYLTLKHIILEIGPEYSRLRPKFYTWIFICCDLFSLILQGSGGGIASAANNGSSAQKAGNNLMMAGICFQVFTLLVFGTLTTDFVLSARRNRSSWSQSALALTSRSSFKIFVAGMFVAYFTIFVRCVYRIAEMANGWGNSIMQDEGEFIAFEGVMILIATIGLTVSHPGWMFPEMQMHGKTPVVSEFTEQDAEKVAGGGSPAGSLEKKAGKKGRWFRRS